MKGSLRGICQQRVRVQVSPKILPLHVLTHSPLEK